MTIDNAPAITAVANQSLKPSITPYPSTITVRFLLYPNIKIIFTVPFTSFLSILMLQFREISIYYTPSLHRKTQAYADFQIKCFKINYAVRTILMNMN